MKNKPFFSCDCTSVTLRSDLSRHLITDSGYPKSQNEFPNRKSFSSVMLYCDRNAMDTHITRIVIFRLCVRTVRRWWVKMYAVHTRSCPKI